MNNHSPNLASKLHAIASPIAHKPSEEMSSEENEYYEAIINSALYSAKKKETLLPLSGFKRTPLVDAYLKHDGFNIVEGGSGEYLGW